MRPEAALEPLHPPVKPPPDDAPDRIPGRLMAGLAGAVLAAFIASLDQRLTPSAIADLRGGFGYGSDAGSWLSTAYDLGFVAVVPITPWLAQMISPRRMIALELVVLTLAAAATPSASTYSEVMALRVLQGAGEGGLTPLLLLLVLTEVPPPRRPEAFVVYGLITSLVPLLSDPIAGAIDDLFTWQALFYLAAATAPIALFLVLYGLPVEPATTKPFRLAELFTLFALEMIAGCLTIACSQGQRLDWFDSGLIVALFAGALFFLVAFVWQELTAARPMINLKLLTIPNFAAGLTLLMVFNFAVLGASDLLPQDQSIIRRLRPLQVGQTLLWLIVPQLVAAPLAAALIRVVDARVILAFGLGLASLGAYLCSYITPEWAGTDFLPPLLLLATGWPLTLVPLVFLTTSVLKPEDGLSGSILFNIPRTLAPTIGTAVVTGILTVRERVHSNIIAQHVVAGAQITQSRLADGGLAAVSAAVRAEAYVRAFADTFGWLSVIVLAAMAIVLVQTGVPVIRARR